MRQLLASLIVVLIAVGIGAVGCAPAVAPPAPTAAPTKAAAQAAAPTAAPAAPTAAPAAPTKAPEPTKIAYPEKGKAITMIVPFAAGGGTDVAARAIAVPMEKDLGVPIQIVNKPGATTQLGMTDMAQAKPDGYSLGMVALPTGIITYLDQSRGAVYTRKSFQPIAMIGADPIMFSVKSDSPIKTLKDLESALKAKPESLKAGTTGIGSVTHLGGLAFEQATGTKMTYVHFDSTPAELTALVGGHIDVLIGGITAVFAQYKSGEVRPIGVMDTMPNPLAPEVPTFESQGYKVYAGATYGIVAPAGTLKEIVDRLSAAVEKGMAEEDVKQKQLGMGQTPRYQNAATFEKSWSDMEEWTKALMAYIK